VGTPLSTETELCRRYGVSRWAIREALAIVQNDGLVEVKRGRGGGTVVSSPPAQSLAASLCGFLLYAGMGPEQVIQARQVLEGLLYSAAATNPAEPSAEALELLATAEHTAYREALPAALYHQVLELSGAEMTGTLALALSKLTFCQMALTGVESVYLSRPEISFRIAQLRFAQLRAFIGKDAIEAYATSSELAEMFRRLLSAFNHFPAPIDDSAQSLAVAAAIAEIVRPGFAAKSASIVATRLMLAARSQARPSHNRGEHPLLGSEAELVARYEVPRNVLREAIRILERDGFVWTEQGRSGGIMIGATDESAIVRRSSRLFRLARPAVGELDALERECRMVALAAILLRTRSVDWLLGEAAMLRARPEPGRIERLFRSLAQFTGNWFLIFVDQVCQAVRAGGGQPADEDLFLDRLIEAAQRQNLPVCRRLIASLYPSVA